MLYAPMSWNISQSPSCSSGSSTPSAIWSSGSPGGPRRLLHRRWSGQGFCGGENQAGEGNEGTRSTVLSGLIWGENLAPHQKKCS